MLIGPFHMMNKPDKNQENLWNMVPSFCLNIIGKIISFLSFFTVWTTRPEQVKLDQNKLRWTGNPDHRTGPKLNLPGILHHFGPTRTFLFWSGPDIHGLNLDLTFHLRKYKDRAEHDQKLLNIMFHFNPHLLHQLECSWNFKNNFCTDAGNVCQHAEENGAGAVHGITSAFFGDVNPTFRGLYEGKW